MRFAPPAAPPEDVTRRYLFLSDGYYKDLKADIAHTVEPLPFAAMSQLPVPGDGAATRPTRTTSATGPSGTRATRTCSRHAIWSSRTGSASGTDTTGTDDGTHRSLNTRLRLHGPGVQADRPSSAEGACGMCHAVHGAKDAGGALVASGAHEVGARRVHGHRRAAGVPRVSPRTPATARTSSPPSSRELAASTHHDVYGVGDAARSSAPAATTRTPTRRRASSRTRRPSARRFPTRPTASGTRTGASTRSSARSTTASVPSCRRSRPVSVSASDPTRLYAWWRTNENSNGFVDWGPTTAYGNTTNSIYSNYTYHNVQPLNFTIGTTWHYRMRSVDALGNTTTTQDYTYRVPYTRLTAGPTVTGGAGGTPVTVTWSTLGACDTLGRLRSDDELRLDGGFEHLHAPPTACTLNLAARALSPARALEPRHRQLHVRRHGRERLPGGHDRSRPHARPEQRRHPRPAEHHVLVDAAEHDGRAVHLPAARLGPEQLADVRLRLVVADHQHREPHPRRGPQLQLDGAGEGQGRHALPALRRPARSTCTTTPAAPARARSSSPGTATATGSSPTSSQPASWG